MNLKNVLTKETVALGLSGTDKAGIIGELLDTLMKTGKVADRERALSSILERERKMSTGMKHAIAIPHGKTDAVTDLVACVGVSKAAVDFDALDGKPCRIFIMTLSPADKTGPHLQFLAEVSLLFKSEEKRAAILAAKTPDEVIAALTE
ncbi:MAG: PTS sugar transporter subunit IIA [Spirochaetales bacterium]|nr:PTS sugar transporter subunit IIA [Spirochaetales bacterium]